MKGFLIINNRKEEGYDSFLSDYLEVKLELKQL